MRDIIIVGGGPSGCFTGKKLAKKGFDVTIIEEDNQIGHPMCCAGIVGDGGMRELGLDPSRWSLNKLREGVVYSPNNESVRISRDKLEAHCIKRSEFDKDLAISAAKEGAEIRLNSKCLDVSRDETGVSVKVKENNGTEELRGRIIVGADGANSMVARNFNLIEEFSPLAGVQAEVVGKSKSEAANIFFKNEWTEHFFAWVVPAGEVYRVGLCDRKNNVRKNFKKFIRKNPVLPKSSHEKITRYTTDIIPKSGERKIFDDRVILVGDAGGQVKPLTGGGIYMGLSCAEIASEVITEGLEKEPRKDILREYDEKVDEKFGKEFEIGNRIMNILKNMEDEDISKFFNLLKKPYIKKMILEDFKFDEHSHLLKEMAKKMPRLVNHFGLKDSAKYLRWLLNPQN